MIFKETPLPGAYVIEPERISDPRGFFTRVWCKQELQRHGLKDEISQSNVGFSHRAGTVRGLHFQKAPRAEVKIVRCTRGSMFDVIVDLRRQSAAFKRHVAVTLSSDNRKMLYVPEGCAHGFQTLEDETEVFYQISQFYVPQHGRGVRWDDPAFAIPWPQAERIIIERDRNYPDFSV